MKKRLAVIAGAAMMMALTGCSAEAANSTAKEPTAAAVTEAKKEEASSVQSDGEKSSENQTAQPVTGADIQWPKENITLHVPGSAGGATDTAARIVGDYLEKVTGGTVVIQNEPTGSGAVMLESIRTSDNPDYHIAIVGSQGVNLYQNGQYEYDVRDSEQFSILNRVITGAHSNAFVCSKDSPFQTFDEFVTYIHENPGKARIVISSGSLSEAYTAILCKGKELDVKLLQASSSEQVTNVLGGMADCFVASYNTLEGYEGTGDLVPLVFISKEREAAYPEIPSFTDIGLGDKIVSGGQFIIASKGMKPEVVQKLNDIFLKLPEDPEFAERAETTNNQLDVLNHEDSIQMYEEVFEMYGAVK